MAIKSAILDGLEGDRSSLFCESVPQHFTLLLLLLLLLLQRGAAASSEGREAGQQVTEARGAASVGYALFIRSGHNVHRCSRTVSSL